MITAEEICQSSAHLLISIRLGRNHVRPPPEDVRIQKPPVTSIRDALFAGANLPGGDTRAVQGLPGRTNPYG